MNVGKRIQLLRKAAGLTRRQLAARAGVAPSIVTMAEERVLVPDQSLLARLYKALDPREPGLQTHVFVPVRRVLPTGRVRRVERAEVALSTLLEQASAALGRDAVAAIEREFERRPESDVWRAVLNRMPFASGLEAILAVRLLLAGARITRVRLSQHGFPWPIVDPRIGVFTGLSRRWALALGGILLTPAVTVQLPSVCRRLSFACAARGHRFFALEIGDRPDLEVLPTLRLDEKTLHETDLLAALKSFHG
ncbi:MAG: helix-turn-helix domain-containing protein [Candidatus Xenobia bacterium]